MYHGDSECLTARWVNRGWQRTNRYWVKNECFAYGTVKAKIDVKQRSDQNKTLNHANEITDSATNRIRNIYCCTDTSDLCNKSDVLNEAGCLAQFAKSGAADECRFVEASAEDERCTIDASCSTDGQLISEHPPLLRGSTITVDYLDTDDVVNCSGVLRSVCP